MPLKALTNAVAIDVAKYVLLVSASVDVEVAVVETEGVVSAGRGRVDCLQVYPSKQLELQFLIITTRCSGCCTHRCR